MEKSEYIKIISRYAGCNKPIECFCKRHNVEFITRPVNLLRGSGCPTCTKESRAGKAHIQDEFIKKFRKIKRLQHINIVGQYENRNKKIKCYCTIHDNYFESVAGTLLIGSNGCEECVRLSRIQRGRNTHSQFMSKLSMVNNKDFDVVGEYEAAHTNIRCFCRIHRKDFYALPYALLKGDGCPICSQELRTKNLRRSQADYELSLGKVTDAIICIDTYICANTSIKHKCIKCNHVWSPRPNDLLKGHGCPKCFESKLEKRIAKFLSDNDIVYQREKTFEGCKRIYNLKFDFYIPHCNILIEANGKQHYESVDFWGGEKGFKIRQERDGIKRDYCTKQNIRLIEISYLDEDIIENTLAKELCLEVSA